jgi:hypothetical protein
MPLRVSHEEQLNTEMDDSINQNGPYTENQMRGLQIPNLVDS